MNRILMAVALGLAAIALPSFAGTTTTSVTVTGSGPSEAEATAAALAKASAQVNGTQASTSVSTGRANFEAHGKSDVDGKKSSAEIVMSAGSTPDIRTRSSGRVSHYDEVSSTHEGDVYKVTIKAYFDKHLEAVHHYKAQGASTGKTRLAIFPPSAIRSSYEFFGNVSNAELADNLRDALERSFVRAGTFSVLDRQTLGASLAELGIADSSFTGPAEKAKLKQIRGADLIVLPRVLDAVVKTKSKTSHITGQTTMTQKTLLEVEVRGIVPATGEVMFADTYLIEQAATRSDAMAQVAARAASDLTAKVTGKSVASSGATPISVFPSQRLSDPSQAPLPPPEETGAKLPFDR